MSTNINDSNDKVPVLICLDKDNNVPIHMDIGQCHRRFFGLYGKYVPNYSCGDQNNTHICQEVTKTELEVLMKITFDHARSRGKK